MLTAALATAGCVTDSRKVQIRPLADPFTKATKAGSPAVAEGRGLLAAGSVGLAIEAFRKALREQPDSVEALAGLAECYDQMGRHDLSQAKYEAALAIAPNDPLLLRTFAASLERQGRYSEAVALRAEAAQSERDETAAPVAPAPAAVAVAQPPVAPEPVKAAEVQSRAAPAPVKAASVKPESAPAPTKVAEARPAPTPAPIAGRTEWKIESSAAAPRAGPASPSVTVKLPPVAQTRTEPSKPLATTPAPQPAQSKVAVTSPAPQATPPKVAIASPPAPQPVPPKVASSKPSVGVPKVAAAAQTPPRAASIQLATASRSPQPAKVVAPSASITVKLPPPRPAIVEKPVSPAVRAVVAEAVPAIGPRLERLSLGEVALLTDPRPRWRSEPVRYMAINAAPRFVPLAELQQSYGVRLLNAARHQGLAANTRLALSRQGWKRVTIGDAARIRQKSLVLYSAETEKAARRLAAQFGFWIAREARPGPLTVLLGRDWVARRQARG